MNTKELKIYNNLIKQLLSLEQEDYKNREKIVRFIIETMLSNGTLINDPEIYERISLLIDSSNIVRESLSLLATSTEQDYEVEDATNLGSNYSSSLLISNLYIAHDKYLSLLGNYRLYKQENYHVKYLVDNKIESLSVSEEIKEVNNLLVKIFNLKI